MRFLRPNPRGLAAAAELSSIVAAAAASRSEDASSSLLNAAAAAAALCCCRCVPREESQTRQRNTLHQRYCRRLHLRNKNKLCSKTFGRELENEQENLIDSEIKWGGDSLFILKSYCDRRGFVHWSLIFVSSLLQFNFRMKFQNFMKKRGPHPILKSEWEMNHPVFLSPGQGEGVTAHSEIILGDELPCIFVTQSGRGGGGHTPL